MKKILCSLSILFALASCATVEPKVVEKIVTKEVKVEVEKSKTSWVSCDYKKQINQGICIFDLEKDEDTDGLGLAASTMTDVFCNGEYGYTEIFPIPDKEKMYYAYFKCGKKPVEEESGKSL